MADLPWIRFFPSDWLAGTRGMSAAETGIYITLIATMYERGEPVPEDHKRLARLCGASVSAFRQALETLVEEGKIQRIDGGLWNDRVGKENEIREEKSEVGRQAANARWKKKDNKNKIGDDAKALQSQSDGNANQKPYEEKEELRSSKKGTRLRDDFAPDIGWAMSHGLSQQQAQREAEKFRNYWVAKPGQGGVKKDWPATWRNWVLNCADRLGLPPPVPIIEDDKVWVKRLVFGRERLIWSSQEWGPRPYQPGCRVPNHLLEPADGTEWREWKREAAA